MIDKKEKVSKNCVTGDNRIATVMDDGEKTEAAPLETSEPIIGNKNHGGVRTK